MDTTTDRMGRLLIVALGALVAAVIGWVIFVFGPGRNLASLLGIVATIVVAMAGARFATNLADSYFPVYNTAEVSVEGPIRRERGSGVPNRPSGTPADAIVDQIETADRDGTIEALIVHLNTPGGEVVPSDDIRRAAKEFDGPTIAYATDTCASGGYWIASGCDRIVAREGSIVGSIGVRASRVTAGDLLDRVGLTYERLVAGDYKDAGVALREMDEADRDYLQGIVDDYYETFLDRVAEGRDIDEDAIRETEARVFLGPQAADIGLVDQIGTRDAVEEWVEDELQTEVSIREFEPPIGLAARLRGTASHVAYAFGAGVTAALTDRETETSVPRLRS